MSVFDILFGKRPVLPHLWQSAPVPEHFDDAPPLASSPHIYHDPYLIWHLKVDHQHLLCIFGHLATACANGNLTQVEHQLGHFRAALTDHLVKEDARLYAYLDQLLEGEDRSRQLVDGFRREMEGIDRAVAGFLGTYENIAGRPDRARAFHAELSGMAEAMLGRIEREESILFPLYRPPAH